MKVRLGNSDNRLLTSEFPIVPAGHGKQDSSPTAPTFS